jgi:hypothetical protein
MDALLSIAKDVAIEITAGVLGYMALQQFEEFKKT